MYRSLILLGLITLAASQFPPNPPPDFWRIGLAAPLSPVLGAGSTLFLPSETSVPILGAAVPVQIHLRNFGNPAFPQGVGIDQFTLGTSGALTGQNQPCRPFPTAQVPPVVPLGPNGNKFNFDQVQYAVATSIPVIPAGAGPTQTIQFNLPIIAPGAAGNERWNSQKLEIASVPVALCYRFNAPGVAPVWFTTGFFVQVEWDCIQGNPLQDCSQYQPNTLVAPGYESLTVQQRLGLTGRTQCCRGIAGTGLQVGVCINPNQQRCCGGAPYSGQNQKCCNPTIQKVQRVDTPCFCAGSSTGVFQAGDIHWAIFNPQDLICPTGEKCCLPSKYTETDRTLNVGNCYNPNDAIGTRCCDTGNTYDPGTYQCCVINGLQSVNNPCPCASDDHCTGSQVEFKSVNGRCCRQTDPAPREQNTQRCNIYANAPTPPNPNLNGNGPVRQRCVGSCIDIRYQICCNGVACIQEYERCCNATCCNKFSHTCDFGERTNTPLNRWNNNNFRVIFQHCSTIEQLNPPRAILIFVLPLFLMLLTLFSFAVAIVFANKATTRSYSGLETAMIITAVGAGIFAISLYFSPMWKYGLWIVLVCILSFLAAAARVFTFNAVVFFLQFVAIFYILDPMHASRYLNVSTFRDPNTGLPLPCTYGLYHTTQCMADLGSRNCRSYYDYFGYDSMLRDTDRFENPQVQAWGYCDRHWFTTLLIFEVIMTVFLIVLFFLTLLGLLLRFRSLIPEPIQLEIIKEQPEIIYPVM